MRDNPFAFISYRRSDSQQAATGLYFQLRQRFGCQQVFMDVGAIAPGDRWPVRLQRALDRATVVLALVGPEWLVAADAYGRRRLDQTDDWVQRELAYSLSNPSMVILPLLVGGLGAVPPQEALPAPLKTLFESQAFSLRDDYWESDVSSLARRLNEEHGFREMDPDVMLPVPQVRVAALTDEQLDRALLTLHRWEVVETTLPRDYPKSRHELRRAFRFSTFATAIRFIELLGATAAKAQHHPRIENQWRTVLIHLSTWDIGQRISQLDVDLAHAIDALYEEHASLTDASRGGCGPTP